MAGCVRSQQAIVLILNLIFYFPADSTNAAAAVAQAAIQQANAVKHLVNKQVSLNFYIC